MNLAGTRADTWDLSGADRYCAQCESVIPPGGTFAGDGPDPCLGMIPGVSHACCGHGDAKKAYAVLGGAPDQSCTTIANGIVLREFDALEFFSLVGRCRERLSETVPTTPSRRDCMTEVLTLEERAYKIEGKLLKKKALTADELAARAGFTSGRSISRAISVLKQIGAITVIPGRKPKYLAAI